MSHIDSDSLNDDMDSTNNSCIPDAREIIKAKKKDKNRKRRYAQKKRRDEIKAENRRLKSELKKQKEIAENHLEELRRRRIRRHKDEEEQQRESELTPITNELPRHFHFSDSSVLKVKEINFYTHQ